MYENHWHWAAWPTMVYRGKGHPQGGVHVGGSFCACYAKWSIIFLYIVFQLQTLSHVCEFCETVLWNQMSLRVRACKILLSCVRKGFWRFQMMVFSCHSNYQIMWYICKHFSSSANGGDGGGGGDPQHNITWLVSETSFCSSYDLFIIQDCSKISLIWNTSLCLCRQHSVFCSVFPKCYAEGQPNTKQNWKREKYIYVYVHMLSCGEFELAAWTWCNVFFDVHYSLVC